MTRVGIASFAHLHADAYAAALGQRLVGVWDDDPGRGQARAAEHGAPFFPEYDRLLEAVDAVVVTAENARHRDLAVRAAERGKHVLCEKPIATTLADARAILDAAAAGGVRLQTAFPCPYSPAFRRLVELVRAGEVGDVIGLACTNHGRMPGRWFVDPALSGGGAVMDHTVHVADLLMRLLGPVRRVYAEISDRLHKLGVDDCGLLTLDFDRGVYATLDTSWSRPRAFPTWGDVTMHVTGTRGTLLLDMFGQGLMLHSDRTGRSHQLDWGPDLNRLMVDDFLAAVEQGREPTVTGQDGLRALEVALAAYRSAELASPVELPIR